MYGLICHQSMEQCVYYGDLTLKPNSQLHKGMSHFMIVMYVRTSSVDIHAEINVLYQGSRFQFHDRKSFALEFTWLQMLIILSKHFELPYSWK
ncbi:hypothetical protein C0J52_00696 [Blattella germanica]|nr:hypothetical protein C0J52_00696 [Blattella germanica]